MRINSRVILAFFVFCASLKVFTLGDAQALDITESPSAQTAPSPSETQLLSTSLRCGVDTLYIALNFLSGKSGVTLYRDLTQAFPNIEKNGTNLSKIQQYLEKEGFICRYMQLDDKVLESMSQNSIAFLLREGKPVSHVVLLSRKEFNIFRISDTTKEKVQQLTLEEAMKLRNNALFAAKESKDLPTEESFLSNHYLSLVFFVLILCLIALSFFKFGKSKKAPEAVPFQKKGTSHEHS